MASSMMDNQSRLVATPQSRHSGFLALWKVRTYQISSVQLNARIHNHLLEEHPCAHAALETIIVMRDSESFAITLTVSDAAAINLRAT